MSNEQGGMGGGRMGILQDHMMDQENFTVKQPKSSETPPPPHPRDK